MRFRNSSFCGFYLGSSPTICSLFFIALNNSNHLKLLNKFHLVSSIVSVISSTVSGNTSTVCGMKVKYLWDEGQIFVG